MTLRTTKIVPEVKRELDLDTHITDNGAGSSPAIQLVHCFYHKIFVTSVTKTSKAGLLLILSSVLSRGTSESDTDQNIRRTGNVFLCIAHPDERKKYWKPAALLHRLFASSEDSSLTLHELESRGYRVEVLPLPASGQGKQLQINWERGK